MTKWIDRFYTYYAAVAFVLTFALLFWFRPRTHR